MPWRTTTGRVKGLPDSSTRGVWRLTEKGQATRLSYAQARVIFRKQVKVDAEARKRKRITCPIEEEVGAPKETGLTTAVGNRERLLATIQALPFDGFERLCRRLLREAGFQ